MDKLIITFCCILLFVSCTYENLEIAEGNVSTLLKDYATKNLEDKIEINTTEGLIKIRLYENTPLHRANFIRLIKNGYYEDGSFYRTIAGFMIQGGNAKQSRYKYLIPNEINKSNICKKGALCMAHYDVGNPENKSSATEFFIVHGHKLTPFAIKEDHLQLDSNQLKYYTTIGGDNNLDGKYTVFGEVVEGISFIDKIAEAPVNGEETPIRPVNFKISISK
jgi:cyclophilin family peptidyl-prolyl cis-trans isomerase